MRLTGDITEPETASINSWYSLKHQGNYLLTPLYYRTTCGFSFRVQLICRITSPNKGVSDHLVLVVHLSVLQLARIANSYNHLFFWKSTSHFSDYSCMRMTYTWVSLMHSHLLLRLHTIQLVLSLQATLITLTITFIFTSIFWRCIDLWVRFTHLWVPLTALKI